MTQYTNSIDPILLIQQGLVAGHSVMEALGFYEGGLQTTNGEDVCRWFDVGASPLLPTPSRTGEQMTIVSSSDDDTILGTGVRQVEIHYMDDLGVEQVEVVDMDGQTDVDTVATDMIFINDIHSVDLGSNRVAAGNITIRKKGATILAGCYNFVTVGGNKSEVPHRMVPAGKTLFLKGWHAEESKGKRAGFKLRSTDLHGEVFPGVFLFKDVAYLNGNASGYLPLPSIPVPSFSVVKATHFDDVNGSEGSCRWWGVLADGVMVDGKFSRV